VRDVDDQNAATGIVSQKPHKQVRHRVKLAAVVAAIKGAADVAVADASAFPAGVRQCNVCGAVVATPQVMRTHIAGKRHCTEVARQLLQESATSIDTAPTQPQAAAAFARLSSTVLATTLPEPPDVSFVLLHEAFRLL
jgi:hypothetical protein